MRNIADSTPCKNVNSGPSCQKRHCRLLPRSSCPHSAPPFTGRRHLPPVTIILQGGRQHAAVDPYINLRTARFIIVLGIASAARLQYLRQGRRRVRWPLLPGQLPRPSCDLLIGLLLSSSISPGWKADLQSAYVRY